MKTSIHFLSYFALRLKDIWDKSCRETRKTHFMFNNLVYILENPAVYEIMWKKKKMLYSFAGHKSQMIIWRMHIACWILKDIKTHTGCVTLNAFQLQQSLRESARMLCYAYIACLVRYKYVSNRVKLSDTWTEASLVYVHTAMNTAVTRKCCV